MRKILVTFLVLLISIPSWSATAVLHVSGGVGGASPATNTITTTTLGNGLVVCAELVDNTKVITAVACGTNNLVQGTSCNSTNSTQTTAMDCWYIANLASSCTSAKVTAGATIGGIFAWEITGGETSSNAAFFDKCGVANNLAVASTLTGPSMTTTSGGETILCAAADSNNCTSVTSPYIGFLAEDGHGSGSQSSASIISASAPVFHDSSTGGGNVSCIAVNPPASAGSTAAKIRGLYNKGEKLVIKGAKVVIK